MPLDPGARLGRYEIVRLRGKGGMGEVYRARDSQLGREVAIKVLPPELSRDPHFKQRFVREARTISQLQHPNVCTLHDVGAHDGVDYLVMEYLEGETLEERLRKGALPMPEVVRIGSAIAEAVHAAHRRGVVHRDLKPGNVMLTAAGPKVVDFGLAKDFARSAFAVDTQLETALQAQPPATAEGTIAGTLEYMAPEQLEGREADARTDVWALGCILYEMATAARPFAGASRASLIGSILKDKPEPLSRRQPLAPSRLDWIVTRCLEKDPERRWQSARDVSIELDAVSADAAAPGDSKTAAAASRRRDRARSAAWVASILATVGLTWLAASLAEPRGRASSVAPTPGRELRIRQLTGRPSEDTVHTAALSPDGEQLAFATQEGLFLQIVETGEERLLPLDQELQTLEVDWLGPTNLLFSASTSEGVGLYKTSIFGGASRKLADGGWRAAVTPDGSRIAYLEGMPGRTVAVCGPDGESPRRVLDLEERGSVWEIAWSPDGRWLLAGIWLGALDPVDTVLEAIDPESRERKTVLADALFFQNWRGNLPFLWTADDRLVIGRREPVPNAHTGNLWQVAIDRATATVQGDLTRLTQLTETNPKDLSAAADGRRLTFLRERSQDDVLVADLEDGGRRIAAVRHLTKDERRDVPLAWAPDSRTVFFQTMRTGTPALFGATLDASGARFVADGVLRHYMEVARDGRSILFWRGSELVRAPTEGGPAQGLLRGTVWPGISCSASGDACLVGERSDDGTYGFWEFDPRVGRGQEVLRIEDRPPFTNWDLSPEGSRVVVGHNDGRLRIFELATGVETVLEQEALHYGEYPAWASDGQGIFVDGGRPTRGRLQKGLLHVSAENGEARVLRLNWNEWDTHAVPSPDGKHLAFAANFFYDGNAWLIEDF